MTTGIALSVTFSSAEASPLPMLLVSWVLIAFLAFEARRYVFYDIFRMRVRVMEVNFYAPMLAGTAIRTDNQWNELLATDYRDLRFHITYWEALGRRLRRNYAWLFVIQLACYAGKIIVHPTPLARSGRAVGARRHRPCSGGSRPGPRRRLPPELDRGGAGDAALPALGRPAEAPQRRRPAGEGRGGVLRYRLRNASPAAEQILIRLDQETSCDCEEAVADEAIR